MKMLSIRDWLIDSILIAGLTGSAIFFEPWLAACFIWISLQLGRTLFWVHSTILGDFLPHIIVGGLLGIIAAWLVRHRKLFLALLPSALFSVYCFLYFTFGAEPYHWGQVLWLDSVIVGDWLLMLIASFVCARFILRRRQPVASPISGNPPA